MDYKPKKITKDITKMTMDTLPPSINMKVQQYRHVDYVQFMNSAEISNFVNYWLNSFEERVGWLYGYYAEDPDYELGIRAVVEAIYEPPQSGTYNNCEIKHDPFETQVEMLSGGLGLQKIGWIYTSKDHDTFMSPEKIQKAAQYQLEHLATHQLGFKVPKFITVVLKRNRRVTPAKKDNSSEILPEVFMISDLGTAMERDGVFTKEQPEKTKLRIRKSDNECIVPNVLMGGTPQVEIDHEFFLISVGSSQFRSTTVSPNQINSRSSRTTTSHR